MYSETCSGPNMSNDQAKGVLHHEFQVTLLNEDGIAKALDMAKAFSDLVYFLERPGMCVSSRELSLAKTKLEEACFFAKKAMALNLTNQKGR